MSNIQQPMMTSPCFGMLIILFIFRLCLDQFTGVDCVKTPLLNTFNIMKYPVLNPDASYEIKASPPLTMSHHPQLIFMLRSSQNSFSISWCEFNICSSGIIFIFILSSLMVLFLATMVYSPSSGIDIAYWNNPVKKLYWPDVCCNFLLI